MGAATPDATRAQAVTLMALDTRKRGQYRSLDGAIESDRGRDRAQAAPACPWVDRAATN